MQTSFPQMKNDWIGSLQQGSVNQRHKLRKQTVTYVKMIHQPYGEDTRIKFSVFSPHEAAKYKFSLEKTF